MKTITTIVYEYDEAGKLTKKIVTKETCGEKQTEYVPYPTPYPTPYPIPQYPYYSYYPQEPISPIYEWNKVTC